LEPLTRRALRALDMRHMIPTPLAPSRPLEGARRPARLARAALALALALCGCDDDSSDEAEPQSNANVPVFKDGTIYLSPGYITKVGIRTEAAGVTEIVPVIHVNGVLEYDQRQIAAVGSAIDGRVTEVLVVEGNSVLPETPLATLQSAEVGGVQAELRAIEARSKVARANRRRKQALVKEGIASKRSAEIASGEVSVISAELKAARQRLRALGGAEKGKEIGIIQLTSPIAGEIAEVNVYRGQAVGPQHTAFTVVDYSQLWVRLSVFEGELQYISKDDPVLLNVQSAPDEEFTGAVDFVSPSFDPELRSAEVRVIVPNDDRLLRVGQAVNATIMAEGAQKEALSIPRSAVVMVDGRSTVFVAPSEHTVIPKQVELGVRGPTRVEVLSGLVAGDVVVTKGVFALKSELFR
ncbi:MAG: efflux RND transporter periplasmic adaptor subunit, partial [Myxococcales bacterium]|nr:efflux RND transporter periplasmic adaptor subunit [Myxococcales bacterium]